MDSNITKESLPQQIFIIPMRGCPVFPGVFTTIEVSDPLDVDVVGYSRNYNGLGLLLLRTEDKPSAELTADDFYSVGTFVRIKNQITTLYGTKSLYIETVKRFRVLEMFCHKGIISAEVEYIEEEALTPVEDKAYLSALRNEIARREDRSALLDNLKFNATNIQEAVRLADYLAGMVVPREDQQSFLETLDAKQRIMKVLAVLKQEFTVQKMHDEIQTEVNRKMEKHQREYYLREELKTVREELKKLSRGEDADDELRELTEEDIVRGLTGQTKAKPKLIDRLNALNLEGEAAETVWAEYQRLDDIEPSSAEYAIIRTYLETIADLPWNSFSNDDFSIEEASKILEADHYGIKDVKTRILEFLAVRQLRNDTKGAIVCLVGPPGTGKTSVGISIAKALHKQYYRFSVGGMRDEAEIKGHRRTYIGAMPGQIIKGLKVTKTKNPVFVIDEIDKMGASIQGDPASALLEVLDPEQNSAFRDHYLDIPFDVSNVLFIVTANTTDTIPQPLLDRMEVIELNGYTSEEKLHIGTKYLVPKSRSRSGLTARDVKYTPKVLKMIAEQYAREAGVRNFEKSLDRIHRKVAMEIVRNRMDVKEGKAEMERPVRITEEKVLEYLGTPLFREDEIIRATKPGMSVGLAWTSMGGDVLAVEAQHIPGKGNLKLTGQLGDVMKESANIAFSYVRSISEQHGVDVSWYTTHDIHLHVPEGATPKDGPSAGITMATAIYSLVTGKVMKPDTAMTGELSLLGKVMPIGGLKEKVLAAKRNKVKTIIIPKHNKRDLDKLEDNVKKGLTFRLVGDMEEVLSLVF